MRAIAQAGVLRHAAPAVLLLMAKVVAAVRAAPDAALLERVASGDASALRQLYDAHAGRALALARRILRSGAEAEEVVQEAFVEVWRRAASYDARRGNAEGWLLTIVRTRAIDRLRARDTAQRTASQLSGEPAASAPLPLELASQRQERERVSAALAALPEEQRSTLELAYFEGLTQAEIAARTGAPLGTVKTRVRLALQKLAAALGEEAGP